MPTWATTGFLAAMSRTSSKMASPPAVVPPGESIDRMTPFTLADSRIASRRFSRSSSSVIVPSILTFAI